MWILPSYYNMGGFSSDSIIAIFGIPKYRSPSHIYILWYKISLTDQSMLAFKWIDITQCTLFNWRLRFMMHCHGFSDSILIGIRGVKISKLRWTTFIFLAIRITYWLDLQSKETSKTPNSHYGDVKWSNFDVSTYYKIEER